MPYLGDFRCVLERRETRKCQSLGFLFNCVVERSNIRSDSSGARPTPPESRTCLVYQTTLVPESIFLYSAPAVVGGRCGGMWSGRQSGLYG